LKEKVKEKLLEFFILLKRLVDVFYDIQDVRMLTMNRLRQFPGMAELYPEDLKTIERTILKKIKEMLKQVPIYMNWMRHQKGVGPTLSAALIANIMIKFKLVKSLKNVTAVQKKYALKTKDKKFLVPALRGIEAFETPSRLISWCGLGVEEGKAVGRRSGKKLKYNPDMKTLMCFKLPSQWARLGGKKRRLESGWLDIYETAKQRYEARAPFEATLDDAVGDLLAEPIGKIPAGTKVKKKGTGANYTYLKRKLEELGKDKILVKLSKGHIKNMAWRIPGKIFLQHLWHVWRVLEGLPIRLPYVQEKLGHKNIIEPFVDTKDGPIPWKLELGKSKRRKKAKPKGV